MGKTLFAVIFISTYTAQYKVFFSVILKTHFCRKKDGNRNTIRKTLKAEGKREILNILLYSGGLHKEK